MSEPAAGRFRYPEGLALLAVLALSLALRLAHLDTLLPWFTYEDETRVTSVTLQLLRDWTIDPRHSFYPALPFYLNAIAYWLWSAPGLLGPILSEGPSAVAGFFVRFADDDPTIIMLSRWVSLGFGMGAIVFSHLLFRQYLKWRWAAFATLLVGLNTVAIAMSDVAKTDSLYLFWFAAGYYFVVKYFYRGGYGWLLAACACAGFGTVTKNNYQIVIALLVYFLIRNLRGLPRLRDLLRNRELWVTLLAIPLFAFIGSPYSFLRFKDTLVTAGWLYAQSEIISTYHTDFHVWWLDRYSYLVTVVLPFVFGLPVFWLAVAGAAHNFRKRPRSDLFVFLNLTWYVYIFGSGSGGPAGGAFPYYLFLIAVPLALFMAVELAADLAAAPGNGRRALGYGIAAVLLVTSLCRLYAYHDLFFAPYDRLGPQFLGLAGQRNLMVSVYKPGPALAGLDVMSVWPHEFNEALVHSYNPDVLIIDDWVVAGFRKVYRDQPVAPLVDSFLDGRRGYDTILKLPAEYFGRAYYAALDPEHDVALTALSRGRTPEKEQ